MQVHLETVGKNASVGNNIIGLTEKIKKMTAVIILQVSHMICFYSQYYSKLQRLFN